MKKLCCAIVFLLLCGLIPAWTSPAYAATDTDYAAIRGKWKQLITGGTLTSGQLADPNIQTTIATIENNARSYWASMDTSAGRSAIWYGDKYEYVAGDSRFFAQTYARLRTMAQAYSLSGTTFTATEKTAMKADIISAMDWLYDHWYNPTVIPSPPSYMNQASWPGNWFDFQISAPSSINDILVLMYDEFTTAQIENYVETMLHYNTDFEYGGGKGGTLMTGANMAYKAVVYMLAGANLRSEAPLLELGSKLGVIFEYVTEYPDEQQRDLGDGGFYEDGSYIQHYAFPYIGGYGITLLGNLPKVIYTLKGSPWEINDPNAGNMYRWAYESIEPFIYRGAMMDMVRGREVALPNATDHSKGAAMIRNLLFVADSAPSGDALKLKRMIKYWIQQDTYRSVYASASIPEVIRIRQLMDDSSITPADAPIMNKTFPVMDRVVHLRPNFGFGVSMYSNRIKNYEMLNNQNLRGWYQSEGMTYLYTNDLGQYSDQYWGTIDKRRLPGTTVDTRSLSAKQYAGSFSGTDWVGGTSIGDNGVGDALYGSAGMDLKGQGTTLTGKKSWFMFDDEIVALGAGITSTSGTRIDTIVDNRKILPDASNQLKTDGATPSLTMGTPLTQNGVTWAHLQGDVAGSDIGYYFPDQPNLTLLKEARTGQWSSMTTYEGDNKIVSLNPVKDAYVHEGTHGNENFGTDTKLIVKGSTITDHARKSYMTFDLSGVSHIVSAKLMLFGSNTQDSSSFPVQVRGVDDDSWSESGITWNNSPASLTTALDTVTVDNLPRYHEWDVTSYVTSQVAGDGLATFLLSDQSGADRLFTANSKEASFNKPQLVIQTDPAYTRNYASISIRHGVNPTDKSYSYVLLPGRDEAETSSYAKQPDVAIVRNDAAVQAVREKGLEVTAANFWTATDANPQTAGMMTSKDPAAVMVKENADGTLDVSVSDPTHLNTGTIDIELSRTASAYTTDDDITVSQMNPIRFSVNVNGSMGKTFKIRFTTVAATATQLAAAADAYVRDGSYANTNFGGASETLLRAKTSTVGYSRKSYLKFDLTGVTNVRSAKLKLYGNNNETADTIYVQAFPVDEDNWSETSITWNNAPAASLYPLDTVAMSNTAQYREWDVTSYVQSQLGAGSSAGFMLLGDSLNFAANSKEHTANQPVLLVE